MAALTVALVALAALLLVGAVALLAVAVARALLALVALVSADAALALAALLALYWFVDSRQRRYARGFYSCAEIPRELASTVAEGAPEEPSTLATKKKTKEEEEEEEEEKEAMPSAAGSAPAAAAEDETLAPTVPARVKSPESSCTSETESEEEEDDDDKTEGEPAAPSPSNLKTHGGEAPGGAEPPKRQRQRLGSRARSASAAPPPPSLAGLQRGHRSMSTSSNRSDSGYSSRRHHPGASQRGRTPTSLSALSGPGRGSMGRRATLSSIRAAQKSERQLMEDALRSDGYWIGDFHMPRKVVPRPVDGSASPKSAR